MAKETLTTISERTGFSISTVSRILSGNGPKYRISPRTIQKVEEEAKRCNYVPNIMGRALRTNKSNTIALLIPSIDNPYFAGISKVIITEAKLSGFTILLADTQENEESERDALTSVTARSVDGIIMVPSGNNCSLIEKISRNIPVILVDRYYKGTSLPYVCTDNFKGSYDAVSFLISKGHEKIACIQGSNDTTPTIERTSGYLQALKDHNLTYQYIGGEDFSITNGYLETRLILNKKEKPTAIFAQSNTILLGILKAIKETDYNVPEDFSLISFDNYAYLDYITPSITRISQPTEEIGKLSVKILLQSI